jgi:hypothetical protein
MTFDSVPDFGLFFVLGFSFYQLLEPKLLEAKLGNFIEFGIELLLDNMLK